MGIKRRTIEEAREIVESFLASGLSRGEYCRNRELNENTLQWLQVRLRRHQKSTMKQSKKKTGFTCIEMPVPEEPISIKVSIEDIRIELPEHFKTSEFRKVLNTVRSCFRV